MARKIGENAAEPDRAKALGDRQMILFSSRVPVKQDYAADDPAPRLEDNAFGFELFSQEVPFSRRPRMIAGFTDQTRRSFPWPGLDHERPNHHPVLDGVCDNFAVIVLQWSS
jgi:hypothetical protein